MGDDGGAKLEDVQRALGALVFDAGVRRLLAADDDDLHASVLDAYLIYIALRTTLTGRCAAICGREYE